MQITNYFTPLQEQYAKNEIYYKSLISTKSHKKSFEVSWSVNILFSFIFFPCDFPSNLLNVIWIHNFNSIVRQLYPSCLQVSIESFILCWWTSRIKRRIDIFHSPRKQVNDDIKGKSKILMKRQLACRPENTEQEWFWNAQSVINISSYNASNWMKFWNVQMRNFRQNWALLPWCGENS